MNLHGPLFIIAAFAILEGLAKDNVWFFVAAVALFGVGYGALVLEEMRGEKL